MEGAPVPLWVLVAAGFLSGSIPFAYLAGRWSRGIDLRRVGSGTVGGSMVYEHVRHWMVVPVGLLDMAKAALPAALALRLGYGQAGAIAVGLAAVCGHNWSVFLGFTGGRGLSCILGLLLVVFPWGAAWLLGFLAVGYRLADSAPWALAALASLPLLVCFLDGPGTLPAGLLAMLAITLLKRGEANRRPLPRDPGERWRVLLRRLVFDRDIPDHQAWIKRRF